MVRINQASLKILCYDGAVIKFIFILISLLFYTCFKAVQLVPGHFLLMIILSLIFFTLMISSLFLGRIKPVYFEMIWFQALTWIGMTFMGFWGTFILISAPFDLLNLIVTFFNHGKLFFSHDAYLIIFGLSILITFIGFIQVLLGPVVKEVPVPVEQLPADLEGLAIVQISDLHIGPTIQSRYVKKVVKKTNASNPDLIVITGDLADAHTESIKKHLQPLADLKARYGVFYVTGNHEYYWGIESLLPELQLLGFKILTNTNEVIAIRDTKILVAGIPDPSGKQFVSDHQPDMAKARATEVATHFNILLAHRPDPYISAEEHGFHLQFSGHTHAGQFFPFSLLIPIAHKYYNGLNRHGKLWLYVNPGTGYWGPANRFGITSEITLVRLTRK